MKNILSFFLILICVISSSHSFSQNDVVKDSINRENANLKFYKNNVNELYKLIVNNKVDEELLKKIDQEYRPTVLFGMVIDEKKLNELTIILFLKLHKNNLNERMIGFNLGSYMKRNTSLAFFALHYCKMTNYFDELYTCFIYEWVLTQPEYLKNPYILKEVEAIKVILEEQKYEYPKSLQLKEEMFYKKKE